MEKTISESHRLLSVAGKLVHARPVFDYDVGRNGAGNWELIAMNAVTATGRPQHQDRRQFGIGVPGLLLIGPTRDFRRTDTTANVEDLDDSAVDDYFDTDDPAEIHRRCADFQEWFRDRLASSVVFDGATGETVGYDPHTAEEDIDLPLSVTLRVQIDSHNQRARKMGRPGTLTIREWRIMLRELGSRCVYCERPGACIDHIVPLARGGENTIENVATACRPCNSSKNATEVYEWCAGRGIDFEKIRRRIEAASWVAVAEAAGLVPARG